MIVFTLGECGFLGFRALMLGNFMWVLGMCIEAAVLLRGLRMKIVSRFPLFYSYLLVVFVQDIIRSIFRLWYDQFFFQVYWATQFVSLLMGSLVVFEIYRLGLQEYPGAARMARSLLGAAFLGIFAKTLLTVRDDSTIEFITAYLKLERDLRLVQAVAILLLIVLFLWYAIPFGRNLGGILFGYSVFVAISVVQLSIVSHFGSRSQYFWSIVQPASYMIAIGYWLYALWVPDTVLRVCRARNVEKDYEALASSTAALLQEARARLGSAVRP